MLILLIAVYGSTENSFLVFDVGMHYTPKEAKPRSGRSPQGEDSAVGDFNILAIADGVGGTKEFGIDSGIYARNFTSHIYDVYYEDVAKYSKTPKQIAAEAYNRNENPGSCTLVVATLSNSTLHTAFIGDSGYKLFSRKEGSMQLVYASSFQITPNGAPFQIGRESFSVSIASEQSHKVEHGDFVVMGTDGLFDNVHSQDLQVLVNNLYGRPAQEIADLLGSVAVKLSKAKGYYSPHAARKNSPEKPRIKGKEDDIAVVVAYIISYKRGALH